MYLDQLLFHLIQDGRDNRLVVACSEGQREFIAGFLEYLVEDHVGRIGAGTSYPDDVLKAHEIWSAA